MHIWTSDLWQSWQYNKSAETTISIYGVGTEDYLHKNTLELHIIHIYQFQVDERFKCERKKHKAFRKWILSSWAHVGKDLLVKV